MKKVIVAIACLAISSAVNAQEKRTPAAPPAPPAAVEEKANPNAGKFKFVEETHDFGEVAEGPQAETDFTFTNVGKEPIVITNASGSCGCTVPQWPKEPILPGKKASIHVTYNTTGRPGPINKQVFIQSNAQQSPMTLFIKGTVKAKATDAAAAPAAPAPAPAQAAH